MTLYAKGLCLTASAAIHKMLNMAPLTQANGSPLPSPTNRLLAAMSPAEYEWLAPHLQRVLLKRGAILYNAGDIVAAVYFVNTGLVSHHLTHHGQEVEIGLVGNEGLIDVAALLPNNPLSHQTMVQLSGNAWRLPAESFRDQFGRGGSFQQIILRYQQFAQAQQAQTILCHAFHTVEERLCSWLLMAHDRVPGDELALTQKVIAAIMATRRAGVNVAVGNLRAAGLIDARRGSIIICNRPGLEQAACECYQIVRKQEQLLLPPPVCPLPAPGYLKPQLANS